MLNYREKLEVYSLVNASRADAIAWLEKTSLQSMPGLMADLKARHVIEYLFSRRNDGSLNFALARFGTYGPLLKRLFRTGDKGARLAVLTNVLVGPKQFLGPATAITKNDLVSLIKGFPATQDQLRAYFENPFIPRECVVDILNRSNDFSFIDDNVLAHLVIYLSQNKVITEPHDDTYLDGYGEYKFNQLFITAFKLVDRAPKEQYWAYALAQIVRNLHTPYLPSEVTQDWINQWKIERPEAETAAAKSDSPENQRTATKEKFDPALSQSFWLRYELAIKCLKHGHGDQAQAIKLDHEDKAIRLAYYSTCNPRQLFGRFVENRNFSYPSFKNHEGNKKYHSDEDNQVIRICLACFDRDNNDFVEYLIRNQNFWKRRQERELLNTLAWHLAEDPNHFMDVPNVLRAFEARQRKENPQYFRDDDFIDATEGLSSEELLREIIHDIKSLNEKLESSHLGDLTDHQNKLSSDIVEETQRRLDRLNERISKQIEEGTVDHVLSSMNQKIAKIEDQLKKPSWWLTALLVVLAVVLGANLTSR